MKTKSVFKRYEIKYIITIEQKQKLLELINPYMQPDNNKQSIYNLYLDTNDYLLTRRSLERPVYKEKLRLRSYGKATSKANVYLEIKKKFDDVVYKRRIVIKEENAEKYFYGNYQLPTSQISNEIDYFKYIYPNICPKMFIGYDRQAFFGNDDQNFRITFDENIVYRDNDLNLCSEMYGYRLIPKGTVLMEIKTTNGLPLWLTNYLTDNQIYKTSFSKCTRAYKENNERKKVINYAI
ncbi:MAG: polyphosphate polymerase domain-containing protein [Erysipelotrichaceae bacterium]